MKAADKLIQKIREEQIQLVPRWRLSLKKKFLGAFFFLSSILGALAFSIILFAIQQTDFNLLAHLSHSGLELFLGLLPFFWIILLAVSLLLAMYSMQYSRKGYKFTLARLAGYSAALSILLGTLLFIGGGAQRLESAFAVNFSIYESIEEKKEKLWTMPEQGFLSGRILATNMESLLLEDFTGKQWEVQYQDAFIPPAVLLERGEKVKLVGQLSGKGQFEASEIRPWGGPGFRGRGR